MASRVVGVATRKLTLANGERLLVKDRLSAGERNEGFNRMYRRNPDGSYVVLPDGRLAVDPSQAHLSTITSYLLDWNLTDPQGQPLVIRADPGAPETVRAALVEAAVLSLDVESYDEILGAIQAHEAAMAKERAALKKTTDTAPSSGPTSPSPALVTGPSSTSEA